MILDKKLEIFLTVAEAGSFSRAARKLSLSQSAVSFHVHSLEEELGVLLFHRQGRTIALTPEGECLFREGVHLAQGARRLQDSLSDLTRSLAQRIHLGGDAVMCSFTFPWVLQEFGAGNPGADLTYQHHKRDVLIEMLLEGELDLVLLGYPLRHRKLKSQECFSSDIILVGAPECDAEPIEITDLTKKTMLWYTGDHGIELLLSQRLTELGLPPKELDIHMDVQDLNLLKTSLQAGLGHAFLPRMTLMNELHFKVLREIEVRDFKLEQTTHLLGRRENYRDIVQRFWDFVAEQRQKSLATLDPDHPSVSPVQAK